MTRTSARVEFIRQQNGNSCIGSCCWPKINYIKVDRTFPQILECYKTVHEWTEACKNFDEAFRPINNAYHVFPITLDKIVRVLLVIGMVVFVFFGFYPASWGTFVLFFLLCFSGLVVIAVSLVYMLCRFVHKQIARKKMRNLLRKSCRRESEIHEAVSFYLRQEEESLCSTKYYVECILEIANNGNASDVVESGMNLASIPVATVMNDGSVYTEAVDATVLQLPVLQFPVLQLPVL
jgi:uncharacterized membrane protein